MQPRVRLRRRPRKRRASEWFIAGTEQARFALERPTPATTPRRASPAPADGTIIALDPDIPPNRQRVRFEAAGRGGLQWRIDGKPFARGNRAQWLPWPGRHVVQLVDAHGQVVDEVGSKCAAQAW